MKGYFLDFSIAKLIEKKILEKKAYDPKHKKTKYSLDHILENIAIILNTGLSWRQLANLRNIKHNSIHYHFKKFCRLNIFREVYSDIIRKYFKKNKTGKLKFLSIDSSLIKNHYSSNCAFGYNKKKKVAKLSVIVDSYGIPISALIAKGNVSDSDLFFKNIDDVFVNIKYEKKNNKTKRYFLADKGYDSSKIREKVKSKNIVSIIGFNNRNTKKKHKIRKLNEEEKVIYKKRLIVENSFSWILKNKRLEGMYDKSNSTYMGFLYMSFIKLISKKLT